MAGASRGTPGRDRHLRKQLATARAIQTEFGFHVPLILSDAEHVPYADHSFDLAISEYRASLWCAPYRWIPEAARSSARHPFALCAPRNGQAGTTLLRAQGGLRRLPVRRQGEGAARHPTQRLGLPLDWLADDPARVGAVAGLNDEVRDLADISLLRICWANARSATYGD